jgi:hypothetical protein
LFWWWVGGVGGSARAVAKESAAGRADERDLRRDWRDSGDGSGVEAGGDRALVEWRWSSGGRSGGWDGLDGRCLVETTDFATATLLCGWYLPLSHSPSPPPSRPQDPPRPRNRLPGGTCPEVSSLCGPIMAFLCRFPSECGAARDLHLPQRPQFPKTRPQSTQDRDTYRLLHCPRLKLLPGRMSHSRPVVGSFLYSPSNSMLRPCPITSNQKRLLAHARRSCRLPPK